MIRSKIVQTHNKDCELTAIYIDTTFHVAICVDQAHGINDTGIVWLISNAQGLQVSLVSEHAIALQALHFLKSLNAEGVKATASRDLKQGVINLEVNDIIIELKPRQYPW